MNKNRIRITENELKQIVAESVKKVLKEEFYDFDADNDDLSQFDSIKGQGDYLRGEFDFASEGDFEDKLINQIKGSQNDLKKRQQKKQMEYLSSIISNLTDLEYDFICYAFDEGNGHGEDDFYIDWAIKAWNENSIPQRNDGQKIVNSIINKGFASIYKDKDGTPILSLPRGISSIIDAEHNYWANPGEFKPIRKRKF